MYVQKYENDQHWYLRHPPSVLKICSLLLCKLHEFSNHLPVHLLPPSCQIIHLNLCMWIYTKGDVCKENICECMLFVVQSRSRVQLFVTPWTAASLSVLYCLLEFAQIHVHWVCNEWMWMNQWMWIKWMLGGQCISIPCYHTRNGVYRKAVRCGMCFSLFGNAAYASLQEWTEPWGSLDSYLMVCGHTPPMKTLLWYPWSLFLIQNRRMEQGQ